MKKLFDAKNEIPVIRKDAKNPFFKSGYATLSIIIETVDPILRKQGLFITHVMQGNTLITQIWDGDKALLESRFDLPVNGDIQKIGSAITYAKRYNITAMLNLNIEDDDDGNGAKKPEPTPKKDMKIKLSDRSVDLEADILMATNKDELLAVGGIIKNETTITEAEKTYLRSIYKQKEKEVK